MSFFSYFAGLSYNYFLPFKNLLGINELCKSGFQKKRLFYYSILVYLMGITSLFLSYGIAGNKKLLGYGSFINNLITFLLFEFFYIFLSFSILHFFRLKADLENLCILYFTSSYIYLILLPVITISYFFLKNKLPITNNIVFLFFHIVNFLMKIKVYYFLNKVAFSI